MTLAGASDAVIMERLGITRNHLQVARSLLRGLGVELPLKKRGWPEGRRRRAAPFTVEWRASA